MRKLTLDLNALVVQSFVTDDVAAKLFGTVHGRQHKGHTGQQDTDCSAVDACPSARGCSDLAACNDTKEGCQSNPCSDPIECTQLACSEFRCHETRGCTHGHNCGDSAVDACPSQRGCTEINCPAKS